ncbi:MAG: GNAT family N-acetyltransferase [Nisaea sp.]|jgi:ribosomal protein S18 acetylase RimI-like enzyme|uniref:GNAT family N-acetyltransferase n=1 Tax=Nisaea sp. TaxID=2024842 RepID=UPI001B0856EB|nr:GNAT family N-acetyltransferase [Nisaea sp.]MBO6560959.1 GNAT family N-acetyltransferase [Nisaea sp.]
MLNRSPDLYIRPVAEDDAGEIVLLLNRIIDARSYTSMSETMSVADQKHFIGTLPERAVYLSAWNGASGKLLGVQDCLPDPDDENQCDISTFVSLETFRDGVGSALFERMIEFVRHQGYRRIRAVIRSDNKHALLFYRAMGFRTGKFGDGKIEALFELPA